MDIEVYSRRLATVSNRGSDFSRGNNGDRPPPIRWRIPLATIRTFLTFLVSLAAFSRTFASSARFFVALLEVRFRKSLFARQRFRLSKPPPKGRDNGHAEGVTSRLDARRAER
jgi:hypothetical protein